MFSPGVNLVVGSFVFLFDADFCGGALSPHTDPRPRYFYHSIFCVPRKISKEPRPITDEVRGSFGQMNTHLSNPWMVWKWSKALHGSAEVDRFVMNATRVRDAFVKASYSRASTSRCCCSVLPTHLGLFHALLLFRSRSKSRRRGRLLRSATFVGVPHVHLHMGVFTNFIGTLQCPPHPGIDEPRDQSRPERAGSCQIHAQQLEFRNVEFAYPIMKRKEKEASESVLSGISFKVKQGQTVAIVGQTGAGKTFPSSNSSTARTIHHRDKCLWMV